MLNFVESTESLKRRPEPRATLSHSKIAQRPGEPIRLGLDWGSRGLPVPVTARAAPPAHPPRMAARVSERNSGTRQVSGPN